MAIYATAILAIIRFGLEGRRARRTRLLPLLRQLPQDWRARSLRRRQAQQETVKNSLLEFARVVKAREQTVVSTLYHLIVEAIDARKTKLYKAKVLVKSWANFKELQEYNHVGDVDDAAGAGPSSPTLTSAPSEAGGKPKLENHSVSNGDDVDGVGGSGVPEEFRPNDIMMAEKGEEGSAIKAATAPLEEQMLGDGM